MTEEFFRDKKETKDLEDLDTTKQRRKTLPRKEKKKGKKINQEETQFSLIQKNSSYDS